MATRSTTTKPLVLASGASGALAGPAMHGEDQFGHTQSYANWTVQVSGSATAISGNIQFSLDGTHWVSASSGALAAPGGSSNIGNFAVGTNCAAPYIRVNITSVTGGTVTIVAVGVS